MDKSVPMKYHWTQLYKDFMTTIFSNTPTDKTYRKLVRLASLARKNHVSPTPLLSLVNAEGKFGIEFNQYEVEMLVARLGATISDDESEEEEEVELPNQLKEEVFREEGNRVYSKDPAHFQYSGGLGDMSSEIIRDDTSQPRGERERDDGQLEERFALAERERERERYVSPQSPIFKSASQSRTTTPREGGMGRRRETERETNMSLSDAVQRLQETSDHLSDQCGDQSSCIDEAQSLWRALRAMEMKIHESEEKIGKEGRERERERNEG
eukprot:CAMPEP_0182440488 /NCGR_PEP_ID=MMETSP1167-20130531/87098_1 /TAXON_ID=2988 /ORGANISM="Mallomonas Sp, Strain CCMP3275" /LENGTH=268 /DNA_ID=CAMNT_0024634461 /DNA_START=58 /DNA_END=864 /DNA_ORIENTATION=-